MWTDYIYRYKGWTREDFPTTLEEVLTREQFDDGYFICNVDIPETFVWEDLKLNPEGSKFFKDILSLPVRVEDQRIWFYYEGDRKEENHIEELLRKFVLMCAGYTSETMWNKLFGRTK